MLRLTVSAEEYLMIGDNIKIVFLGGSRNHLRIMVDAPREVDVVRSKAIEKRIGDEEIRATLPRYYAEPEIPEKYRKNRDAAIAAGTGGTAKKRDAAKRQEARPNR